MLPCSFAGFAGSTFFNATDKALAAACVTAYNDWMIDEWCGSNPGRQIPLCLVPFWDIDATVAEAGRVAAKGAKAITFTEMPHALGLPSFHTDHWDPFFAICEEAGMPVCLHFGSGGAPSVAPEAPFTTAIALYGLNSQMATVDLLNTRIFERFPDLKFAMSEGGIGWMPYILERVDYTWDRHRYYTGMSDARKPSEIFRSNIFGCFIYDDAGLHNIDRIGADNVMFESDYPHSDSNWPHTRKMLAESLAHLSDDVAAKIAEQNARRVFKLPARPLTRRRSRLGALLSGRVYEDLAEVSGPHAGQHLRQVAERGGADPAVDGYAVRGQGVEHGREVAQIGVARPDLQFPGQGRSQDGREGLAGRGEEHDHAMFA